jgi:3-hydroxyisobutyrate dehydrogenase-like beta-hydroxyacid dehydrogenase
MTTITLLNPGAMGAAVGAQARRSGAQVLWVSAGRSPASVARAQAAGLEDAVDLESAVGRSDMILSICPPSEAEAVSDSVAAQGFRGVYVEANAISPERMQRIAERQLQVGATPVDGSIIGSPPVGSTQPRLYLAGDASAVESVRRCFEGSLVVPRILDRPIGAACAVKMAYGGFQKAARALAAVSQALAAAYDVSEELLTEGRGLTGTMLGDPGHLPGMAAKAWRWAPEMEEVADAVRAVHLPPDFALAAAATLRHWDADKDSTTISPAEVLEHLALDRSH